MPVLLSVFDLLVMKKNKKKSKLIFRYSPQLEEDWKNGNIETHFDAKMLRMIRESPGQIILHDTDGISDRNKDNPLEEQKL